MFLRYFDAWRRLAAAGGSVSTRSHFETVKFIGNRLIYIVWFVFMCLAHWDSSGILLGFFWDSSGILEYSSHFQAFQIEREIAALDANFMADRRAISGRWRV